MTPAEVIAVADEAGVRIMVDGEHLVLRAPSPAPDDVRTLIRANKPQLLAWLRPGLDGWSRADWHAFYDERAGIAEFDGGFSREKAEQQAFECCVTEWLNRNPVSSSPEQCLGCEGDRLPMAPLLPFGIPDKGVAWLHSRCWPRWHAGQEAKAVASLAVLGVGAKASASGRDGDGLGSGHAAGGAP